jgi:hypothetical protein
MTRVYFMISNPCKKIKKAYLTQWLGAVAHILSVIPAMWESRNRRTIVHAGKA